MSLTSYLAFSGPVLFIFLRFVLAVLNRRSFAETISSALYKSTQNLHTQSCGRQLFCKKQRTSLIYTLSGSVCVSQHFNMAACCCCILSSVAMVLVDVPAGLSLMSLGNVGILVMQRWHAGICAGGCSLCLWMLSGDRYHILHTGIVHHPVYYIPLCSILISLHHQLAWAITIYYNVFFFPIVPHILCSIWKCVPFHCVQV